MIIRRFNNKDYPEILSWWNARKEVPPTLSMLDNDTTFVIERNDELLACMTIILTNIKDYCYLENVSSNPIQHNRKEAILHLNEFIYNVAKNLGYNNIIVFSHIRKVDEIYKNLGYINTCNDLNSFVRRI